MTKANQRKRFESWKAIANFFGRSERTVRRWESQEDLPVHRHKHLSGSRIFAYQDELETWFASRKQQSGMEQPATKSALRVAILPFSNLCEEQDKRYLRDAICEDIVSDMATLPSLTVISYSSMRMLPNSGTELVSAIEQLQLDFYLEGSIRINADKLKFAVNLVNAKNRAVEWNTRYQSSLSEWQSLRERIVSDVVTCLPLSNPHAIFCSSEHSQPANQTAWEYLHQARSESMKWKPESIERALQLLQAAHELASDNSVILANLGLVYLQKREALIDCSEHPLAQASAILEKLQQHNPDAFFTHSLKGFYFYTLGDMPKAIQSLKNALAQQPHAPDALGLLANCYLVTGQSDMSLPLIRTLQIIDPLTPLTRCLPGWHKLLTGEFASAIGPYKEMLDMDPHNPIARLFMVWVYVLNKDLQGAKSCCEGYIPPLRESLPAKLAFAFSHSLEHQPGEFTLSNEHANMASVSEMFARFVAFACAASGDIDHGVTWMKKAFELGFWAYPFLRDHDPFFRPYLDHPEYQALLREIESKWTQQTANDKTLNWR